MVLDVDKVVVVKNVSSKWPKLSIDVLCVVVFVVCKSFTNLVHAIVLSGVLMFEVSWE